MTESEPQFDPAFFDLVPGVLNIEIDDNNETSSKDDAATNIDVVNKSDESVKTEKEKPQFEQQKRQEYDVEEIIDKREKMGVIEYLIQWKGYSKEHNSWEPKSFLSCNELLAEFEKNWEIEFLEYLSKIDKVKKPRGRKHKKLKPNTNQCSSHSNSHSSN